MIKKWENEKKNAVRNEKWPEQKTKMTGEKKTGNVRLKMWKLWKRQTWTKRWKSGTDEKATVLWQYHLRNRDRKWKDGRRWKISHLNENQLRGKSLRKPRWKSDGKWSENQKKKRSEKSVERSTRTHWKRGKLFLKTTAKMEKKIMEKTKLVSWKKIDWNTHQ